MLKKFFFLFTVGFFLVLPARNQDMEYAGYVVRKLTANTFYGRGYVNEGSALAAAFIENELKKTGVEVVPQASFEVPVNTFPEKIKVSINGKEMVPGAEYLVDPSSPSIELQTQSLRFLTSADLEDDKTFLKVLQTNRSDLLVLNLTDTNIYNFNDQLTALKNFAAGHYKAVLVMSGQNLLWGVSQRQAAKPIILINKTFATDTFKNVNINIEAQYHEKYPVQNVIGKIDGTRGDSLLVFTAHYDHLGMMGSNTLFPGANDNASGVAMLLSIARYFASHPPEHDILFIAFAAEELGLLGSQHYVRSNATDLSKIKFLINFDLAGTGGEGIKVVNATKYPKHFEKLKSINQNNELLPAVEPRGEACNSDHCPFDMLNVPCFYIYTLGGIQAYHDIYDRYETLPLTEFVDYAKLIIQFASSL